MNSAEFRRCGYEMIDYVADYMDNIGSRDPTSKCEPGYMRKLIPNKAPESPETWDSIMKDIEPVIMSGMTHWQHPHFHAYFPSANSWPSILGDVLSNSFASAVSSWESCPAATELEMIVLDWLAKLLDLPSFFYSKFSKNDSKGGGCIQSSSSECIFISLLAARESMIHQLYKKFPNKSKTEIKSLLVAYGSTESDSKFDKACMMAHVNFRLLQPRQRGIINGEILKEAVEQDIKKGLVPFFYNAVLGSTSTGVFDELVTLGPVTDEHDMWLHVDATFAGSGFCCPELSYLTEGLEYLSSFNTDANNWLATCFDCSLHWFKDVHIVENYLGGHGKIFDDRPTIDLRYWGVPTTRRFRALKLWSTIRTYGAEGLRNIIRNHIRMTKSFEACVRRDNRFQVVGDTRVGVCCFHLKGGDNELVNNLNATLVEALNSSHRIYIVPSFYQGKYLIRFSVCSEFTTEADVDYAWSLISDYAEVILRIKELEKNGSDKFKKILNITHSWKIMCPRPMNRQVINQIKDYRHNKSKGVKDFMAEPIFQVLCSSEGLKLLGQVTFDLPSERLDDGILEIIEKEGTEPKKVIIDSKGKKLKIPTACFHFKNVAEVNK